MVSVIASSTPIATSMAHSQAFIPRAQKTHHYRLGEILLKRGTISVIQLQLAMKAHTTCDNKHKLGEVLIYLKFITAEELKMALWEQFWRKNGFWVID